MYYILSGIFQHICYYQQYLQFLSGLYWSSKIKLQSLTWVIPSNIFFHEVHLTGKPFATVTINICHSMEKDEPIHWLSHSLLSSYLPYILPNAGHFQWLNPPLEAGKLGILQHETMYQSDLDVRLSKVFFFKHYCLIVETVNISNYQCQKVFTNFDRTLLAMLRQKI